VKVAKDVDEQKHWSLQDSSLGQTRVNILQKEVQMANEDA
jgi:hypothetical protein